MRYYTVTTSTGLTLSVPAASAVEATRRVQRDFDLFTSGVRVTATADTTDVAAVMVAAGLA
jgi:hypothetical protein